MHPQFFHSFSLSATHSRAQKSMYSIRRSKAWESPGLTSQYQEDFPKHCCVTIFNWFVCTAATPNHFQSHIKTRSQPIQCLFGSLSVGQRAIYSPTPPPSSHRRGTVVLTTSPPAVWLASTKYDDILPLFSRCTTFLPFIFCLLPTDEVTVNNARTHI